MKLIIPDYVKKAINTLNSNGFEAYVVGGAVRDAVMGNTPDDWDIATNAKTHEVKLCFKKSFDTGEKHGTVTIYVDGHTIEVTTYRIEGEYEDNRRPKSVEFTSDIAEDLKRRDFTINAMAYNDEQGILDLYGGMEDINNKLIRCVGDARERFLEDALRIMRAVRFSATLGFDIEKDTFDAIKSTCHLLCNISAERKYAELTKTIMSAKDTKALFSSGIMEKIMPEVADNNISLSDLPRDKEIRYSALFFGTDIDDCRAVMNRLKFENKTKNHVLGILKCAKIKMCDDVLFCKKTLNLFGEDIALKTVLLMKVMGKCTDNTEKIFIRAKNEPYKISMLDIDGNDILSLGYKGSEIGDVLEALLGRVMENPKLNNKGILLGILKDEFTD